MRHPDDHDPDLEPIEAIYDALDRGRADEALALARAAQRRTSERDPVLHFLAGLALLELDAPADAAPELILAVELDPEDAEFRCHLALALFRRCDFQAAAAQVEKAVQLDAKLPEAHHVQALVLERAGAFDEAERHFRRAERLDPEGFPAPKRLGRASFEHEVERAGSLLDEAFRRHLDAVAVTVEPLPSDAILFAEEPPLDPELLGLFVGVPLTERTGFSPGGELPPRILIFQRNLERTFPDREELQVEIARTLHHELGHYLGLDEEELASIDLA